MKTRALKAGFAISALALSMSHAMAAELRFDGFASFVAGQVLDKDELYESNYRGYDDKIGFQENSMFALQVRADLQERLSATAQIAAKGKDDYEAKFNWAYLSYELSNEWTARFGRQRIPYFMYSDFLDVGYAYHWIEPPYHVYNLAGFDSADGLSIEYQTDIGPWTSRATAMVGRANTTLESAFDSEVETEVSDILMVNWSMNYDWFTARVVYAQSDLTFDFSALLEGVIFPQLETAFPGGLSMVLSESSKQEFAVTDDKVTFSGVGIAIDPGSFFFVAEATELGAEDSFLQEPSIQWYVSGGLRIGDFTPYITYERVESDYNDDGIRRIMADQPASPLNAFQEAALKEIMTANIPEEAVYSAGLRYNFHPSAAFKVEYIAADNYRDDKKPEAIAIAIDLVY